MANADVANLNPIRSISSIHYAFIIFQNSTKRIVDVYWVDYQGKYVPYVELKCDDKVIVNTYSTHPWIFVDSYSGERMHVEQKGVFWPAPTPTIRTENNRRSIKRTTVQIHFPLRSLRDTAMWTIIKEIMRHPRDASAYEIPRCLQMELTDLFVKFIKYRKAKEVQRRQEQQS